MEVHCTRVNSPDQDDQKKLVCMIMYLMGTMYLSLILSMNSSGVSKWWLDTSFAIHDNMKNRTGAIMNISRSALFCAFTKKIITSSSIEAELVGVADLLPKIL